jgi:hypothetical protein
MIYLYKEYAAKDEFSPVRDDMFVMNFILNGKILMHIVLNGNDISSLRD